METDQGVIQTDYVVVGVGPWIKSLWEHARPAQGHQHQGPRRQACTTDVRMWTYWCLQEGTLGVDPELQRTNDGRMPPVIHVDTDAPLYSDIDGSLITDKLWGIYYKPDFCFGGVQGGAMPYKVENDPDEVRVDPYGPESPEFVVGEDFAQMWCSALAFCQKRFEGKYPALQARSRRGDLGAFTPDSFPVFDVFHQNCYVIADSNHGYKMIGVGKLVARRDHRGAERPPGAVPLLALCRGQAAPGLQQPVSLELSETLDRVARLTPVRVTEDNAMTDLEAYVKAEGRDELVKQVRAKIDELGITYIYYQFVSVTGRIVGKGIPADHWESVAERGFQLVYGATANLFLDRHRQLHRLRPRGLRAGRHPRPGDVRAAALGPARRAGSSARCSATARRTTTRGVPHLRLPRQPAPDPRAVPEGPQGPAPAARHRAGDDVAQEGPRRQAGRRVQQAVLLPHRPVRVAAPGRPEGHRLRPRDGPGHDPGRPRGLARASSS